MSGVTIGYELKLDTKHDNSFNGTYDDISAYMINDVEFATGFTRGQDIYSAISEPVAPPARMALYLDNRTGVFNQETLGSEVITNGNFATWSSDNPSSWTVTGESGTNPEISQVGVGEGHDSTGTGACNIYTTSSTVSISQATLTTNNTYKLTITIGYVGNGTIAIYSGSTRIAQYGEVGTFTEYFVASSSTIKIESLSPCNITIDDVSVKQTARYTGLLRPGALIRFRATYGTTQQLFIGKIAYGGIQYGVNSKSADIQDRMVSVIVQDAMNDLGDKEYLPNILIDSTTDETLTDFFENAVIPWPYVSSSWMLGISGASELDYTAYLLPAQNTNFDVGKTTFAFSGGAADNGKGVQAQQFIRDVVLAEAGGRFFFNGRDGAWTFHNRHRDVENETVSATITTSRFENVSYKYGDDLINYLTINYSIRRILGANSILWSIPNTKVRVEAQSVKQYNGRYMPDDTSIARYGGYDFQPLDKSVYSATSDADGIIPVTSGYSISAKGGATSVEITIDNRNSFPIYVFNLVFRGTPIAWFDQQSSYVDSQSVRRYDQRSKQPLNIKMIDDPDFAIDVLQYIVKRYSTPMGRIDNVTFLANLDATAAGYLINRSIGDRITITDSAINHNADYIIIGEGHRINAQRKDHYVTWFLKPVSRDTSWVMEVSGKSELGITTRLGL